MWGGGFGFGGGWARDAIGCGRCDNGLGRRVVLCRLALVPPLARRVLLSVRHGGSGVSGELMRAVSGAVASHRRWEQKRTRESRRCGGGGCVERFEVREGVRSCHWMNQTPARPSNPAGLAWLACPLRLLHLIICSSVFCAYCLPSHASLLPTYHPILPRRRSHVVSAARYVACRPRSRSRSTAS